MLSNTGPVAKLYLSIIDDVIDSMRELFLDEGLEDRVLDDLRHLWESKMMQSKAMEDFRKNNINSSNFVLQLPANYSQTDQEVTASVVMPAGQNIHSFQRLKNNSETLATFSLPAGLAYPVQIPAGVTLQTASGQLYKVNVPVVVTQAAAGQQPVSQPTQRVPEWKETPAPQSIAVPQNTTHQQEVEPSPVSAASVTQPAHPKANLPPGQENNPPQKPHVPAVETSQLQGAHSPETEVALEENEPSPHPEPVNLSVTASSSSQLLDFQIGTEETFTQAAQLKTRDIDDILKEVIEEERVKAERARSLAPAKTDNQSEGVLGLDLDYNYSELSDIVQLDGPADNSDIEEEEGVPLEENDFLGIINAEAIKALQEGDESSISSSSDSEGVDELANVEEEDPLNSGDDVIEQDIPDLFDTDNVIVCQYDKIHRSKNRWKFHLKDGVMCYGGRDYVFSKAVGEAEW
ncbi:TFIIA-alpha and beta-like factor General transcription factor II A, 1-like factor [Larimichthys crocea]|uniref:TFIIA-alpha and beta-like factor General transcription factor II A, 1-like factor n=2 Tax=Larimichthys crocea TaxID=215358 RepID=A0A6G0HNF5_LARCR|nr:TFIIA-alpha and beta-like factor General transcription factor II A, 1-like factor [Larimichthys crocea]